MIVTHFADHTHDDIYEEPPVRKAVGSFIVSMKGDALGERNYIYFDNIHAALSAAEKMGSRDIYYEAEDQDDWYVYDFETETFVYP